MGPRREAPPGERLPKFGDLIQRTGITANTVAAVLRSLSLQGHVHKVGKAWRAGRRPPQPASPRRTILLIPLHRQTWEQTARADRTRRFTEVFDEEAPRCGLRIQSFPSLLEERREGVLERTRRILGVARALGNA